MPNDSRLTIFDGFAINANTGVITVADGNRPTFSVTDATENTRTLTIRATDTSVTATGDTTATEMITITVTAPPPITLQTSATGGTTSFTINESDGSPVGITTISIATLDATEAAVDPYTIAAGAPAGFAITDEGVLTAQLDYDALTPEQQQTDGITITVQATGSVAGQIGIIELTITVDNIDDEAPVFAEAAPTAEVAGRTRVGTRSYRH